MAGKYSVLILRGQAGAASKPQVVKRFGARNLDDAYIQFDHHRDMIGWSRQHREMLGLHPGEDVTVQVFDHREGFELREATI